ncbi:hypothetical protein SAMN05216578_105108 [Halopseudomonas formosensis]|uniref:Uncharacterized protein n=1 Tax=Halopseudomonas formosensis TaxID=1002526 RepID=A0A1I6BPD3_9GAMM|nr:hypothetical protein [Halopseudomonas formosensis]SFQ82798.1 hypothetical protein SAMN05216578_105108 [Halopseudomonas formosensis]
MRNQLIVSGQLTGGLFGRVYFAEGELDNSGTTVTAYSDGDVSLSFGPMRITLTAEAAAELSKHINRAAEAAGGGQ